MTTTGIAIGQLSEAEHSRQLRRAIVASTVGTIIEAYDFLLYVLVAPLVFAKLYFPESDPLVGILQAFGIYAVGFIARPVGAAQLLAVLGLGKLAYGDPGCGHFDFLHGPDGARFVVGGFGRPTRLRTPARCPCWCNRSASPSR